MNELLTFPIKFIVSMFFGLLGLWLLGVLLIDKEIHLNPDDYEGMYTTIIQMYLMVIIFIIIAGIIGGFVWFLF